MSVLPSAYIRHLSSLTRVSVYWALPSDGPAGPEYRSGVTAWRPARRAMQRSVFALLLSHVYSSITMSLRLLSRPSTSLAGAALAQC